jgi:hypothetical protein
MNMRVGLPELTVVLVMSGLLLIPLAAAVWVLITLNRIRVTQESVRHKLDTLTRAFQRDSEMPQPAERGAGHAEAPYPTGIVCAWCGRPVKEDEAFMLRVGARLCPTCAEDAGRIAADQRLGREQQRPPDGG